MNLISPIISLVVWLVILSFLPNVIIFFIETLPSYKRTGLNNLVKQINKLKKLSQSGRNYLRYMINIIIKSLGSAFIGISIKPIILILNPSFGEGYALWASYATAAIAFTIFPNFFLPKEEKE